MATTLNTKIVNDTFNKEYNETQFKLFIKDLLADADFSKEGQIQLPAEYREFIKSAKRICKYKYSTSEFDENILTVLAVKLKRTTSIDRARTAQRNFVARYLNGSRGYLTDAALVAFYSEDENGNISPDWRFSLVQMNYVTKFVETTTGKKKLKTEVELTPAKRFSFLVGANEDTHTAQAQFKNCLDKASNNEKITIEDLVAAFDIEKVSKEFFDKYKNLYLKMCHELQKLCDVDEIVRSDFETHNVNIDDFAKKTLGQLVFLYFIQKKGWLGVDRDKDWGTGDKKFLRNLFEGKYGSYNNFFNDILEHLFYEALASDRGPSAWFDKLNCRIPFLNGGLFEPVNGYEYQKTDLTIDNNLFKEIFDTFDLYNFTVKEDEPLEKEVAIDPEMLGKVFENLLPENIRKGNGAFYTPREIVHYMCQESLINYLYNKLNIKEVPLTEEQKAEQQSLFKKKKISQLKLTQEVIEEIISKEDVEHLIKKGSSNYSNKTTKEEMPSKVVEYARVLDKALCEIKVCDPAIGSGAFPVGMMNEIVRARAALNVHIGQPDRSIYELKRNAIENSIYGVDIDGGAVEIAKLRFWLSLVVDEEDIKNIKPLPNLDYKIMQGNSLITSYEGIDFDEIVDEYKPNTQLTINLWGDKSQDLKLELKNKQSEFLKTPYATRKIELKKEIEDIIINIVKAKLEIKAKEGKLNLQEMEDKIRNFAQNTENRNFFPWKLFFGDAFEQGGFDVVIGNPPYVKEYTERSAFDGLRELPYYQGKMDLWYFFGCKGLDILKLNGIQSFIAPNNWTTNAGASIFRNKVMHESKVLNFTDFGNYKVFDTASIQTMVYLLCKSINNQNYVLNYSKLQKDNIDKNELETFLSDDNEYNYYLRYKLNFNNSTYYDKFVTFLDPEINNLIMKIQQGNKIYLSSKDMTNGIHPHHDKVSNKMLSLLPNDHKVGEGIFVLNSAELKFIEEQERNIIKPFYTSDELHRYYADKDNKEWIIYTNSSFKDITKINSYPTIKEHLDKFVNVITSDNKPYGLHRAREEKFFCGEKILSLRKCSNCPTFTYTDFDCYVGAMYYIIKPTNLNLKYLTGLLNSKLIAYWLQKQGKMQGNNYQIDKEPLMNIPIYNASAEESGRISSIVDNILNLTNDKNYSDNSQKQQTIKEYENQIDVIVYKLYDLTYQEVLTIDKGFPMSEIEYNNFRF